MWAAAFKRIRGMTISPANIRKIAPRRNKACKRGLLQQETHAIGMGHLLRWAHGSPGDKHQDCDHSKNQGAQMSHICCISSKSRAGQSLDAAYLNQPKLAHPGGRPSLICRAR